MQKIDKTDTLETILTRGRFEVDYYQKEYRWGRTQIDQMLSDFYDTFREYYDPDNHNSPSEVQNYGYYYMGSIICTGASPRQVIDGQQRITSLTLLLIYLRNLQNILREFLSCRFLLTTLFLRMTLERWHSTWMCLNVMTACVPSGIKILHMLLPMKVHRTSLTDT